MYDECYDGPEADPPPSVLDAARRVVARWTDAAYTPDPELAQRLAELRDAVEAQRADDAEAKDKADREAAAEVEFAADFRSYLREQDARYGSSS